jgi:hypothetical protein
MTEFVMKEMSAKPKPKLEFADGFDLKDITVEPNEAQRRAGVIAEFAGTGDFAAAWHERRIYEVSAGRDQQPIIYDRIYDVTVDSGLPKTVDIFQLKDGGVVFEEIKEGGEVKFVTVNSGEVQVKIKHYGTGLEYSKDLRIFNQTWNVASVERRAGIAHNALLNHIHLNPILSYSYAAANQTAAASGQGGLVQNTQKTIASAIANAQNDATNPRNGPYVLLINPANVYEVDKALRYRIQDGIDEISPIFGVIQSVVGYNGWTGARGKKSVSYPGVPANTAYLISLTNRDEDFRSFFKQTLDMAMGNADVSRFIEEQVVWDLYFGIYANPIAAVEEITLPTSGA